MTEVNGTSRTVSLEEPTSKTSELVLRLRILKLGDARSGEKGHVLTVLIGLQVSKVVHH